MSNKIRFSSEGYEHVAQRLKEVAEVLSSVYGTLSGMSLRDEEGGELRLISRMLSLRSGCFAGEMIASAQLKMLARALKAEEGDVQDTIRAVNDAARALEEAEGNIIKLMNGDLTADALKKKENPYGLTDEELEKERRESIDRMLKVLENENDLLNKTIDRERLDKITGYLAWIYMMLAGDPTVMMEGDARKIALALLNTLSDAEKYSDGFLKAFGNMSNDICYRKDVVVSVADVLTNGGGEDFEEFIKNLPITENLNLGNLDALKETRDVLEKVVDAYNQYRQMTSLDSETLDSICNGLRQSGDPTMAEAADLLERMKDKEFCRTYCLAGNGLELSCEKLSEKTQDLLIDLYPDLVGKNVIKISKETTEALTNSSGIVESAAQVERLDDARRKAYDAVQDAADAYKKNPTDENYKKVVDAHNTYEAFAAESLDAFADMADEANDSALGRLNRNDASAIRNIADIHRNSVNNNGLTAYI